MTKYCNTRYSNIRTLTELQAERARLRVLIDMTKEELECDWQQVRNGFSFSNISSRVMGAVYTTSSLARNIISGFSWATSLLGRKRRKKIDDADCGDQCY